MNDDPNTNGLRAYLYEHSDKRRGWLDRMTVLYRTNDPFRCDTPTGHLNGAWFAERVEEFDLGSRTIHLRGCHYPLIGVPKPNNEPYENDDPTWQWLGHVAKAARWLGYVDFDRIHDGRNTPPVVIPHLEPDPETFLTSGWDVEFPFVNEILPTAAIVGFAGRQTYKLVFVGEKSSLEPVLGPLATRYSADLYLPSGEISDTQIHLMAQTAADDGREMICFYFSDCDPDGWQMPISVSRKLQAFKADLFPEIKFKVYQVALSPSQVKEFKLPHAPLTKEEERKARVERWEERQGVGQTEIDALATLQPDVLRELVEEAVAPFFDHTLRRRVTEAEIAWRREARRRVDVLLDAGLRDETERKLTELRQQIDQLNDGLRGSLREKARGFEFPPVEIPEPVLPNLMRQATPLIDSARKPAEQIDRLKAAKNYEV